MSKSLAPRLLLSFATLYGCGQKPESASEPSYAHFPAESAKSGVLGRLEVLRRGAPASFERVRICVQAGYDGYADGELLTDARLAYAAWLEAAGYDAEDWDRLDFVPAPTCDDRDASFAANVRLLHPSQASLPEDSDVFDEWKVSCKKETVGRRVSYGCRPSGGTTGLGSTGIMYFSRGRAQGYAPGFMYLSQYVDWKPLRADIERNRQIAGVAKSELIEAYDELRTKESPDFAALTAFNARLVGTGVTGGDDDTVRNIMEDFGQGSASTYDSAYRPKLGAFHTILHEIGHQMGMDHAHAPRSTSVTGPSDEAKQVNGQWVTKVASMAYGNDYNYLTADDRAGIRAARQAIVEYLDGVR